MTVSDVLVVASLVVALVALAVSVLAIRRDRAFLIVREADRAAGTHYLTVVNVGLRAVRINRVVMRRRRWRPGGTLFDVSAAAHLHQREGGADVMHELPFALEPAAEAVVAIPGPALDKLGPHIGVEDASGRLHWPGGRPPTVYEYVDPESVWP
jgi:hypothetical protein